MKRNVTLEKRNFTTHNTDYTRLIICFKIRILSFWPEVGYLAKLCILCFFQFTDYVSEKSIMNITVCNNFVVFTGGESRAHTLPTNPPDQGQYNLIIVMMLQSEPLF
jgi:hypothetical protein